MGSKNGKPVLYPHGSVAALSCISGKTEVEVRDAFNAIVAEHPNSDGTITMERLVGLLKKDDGTIGNIPKEELTRLMNDMYGLLKKDDPNVNAIDLIAKSEEAAE
eukprot:GFUD01068722.1.p1 GENE.GFUD01068722.1~~GFUD01068722.1.p1  ORF type:complete len:105 (+),score=28.41 GFUD01068722.1:48-362(+)